MTPAELTATRTAMGLSQDQLAKALGISRQAVWRWENGDRQIPPYLPLAIAHIAMVKQMQNAAVWIKP